MPDAPQILNQVVRFHREHNTPQNRQPVGELHRERGVETLGFLRGTNIAVDQTVHVVSKDGNKTWDGKITESVDDDFTREPFNEGPAWFFSLQMSSYTNDPAQEETISVTVTVTDPKTKVTSRPAIAFPDPKDVP